MKIHFITFFTNIKFGQPNYYIESVKRLVDSAKKFGVENFDLYTPDNLNVSLDTKKWMETSLDPGYGYYSWKPLVILESFKHMNYGDVALYYDAGRKEYNYEFKKDFNSLVNKVIKEYNGIGVAQGPFSHKAWCKEDCFIEMECTDDKYYNANQLCATWHIWEKSDLTVQILKQWLMYCFHPSGIVTTDDKTKILSKFPEYKQHRWDQAILTNLLLKYKFDKNLYTPLLPNEGKWEKDINNFV